MAMARSVTSRNFWGGFWGGVFGILATAKFGAVALLAGCFLGVMLGFYYQELWNIIKVSWSTTVSGFAPITALRELRLNLFKWWGALHPYDRALWIRHAAVWTAVVLYIGMITGVIYVLANRINDEIGICPILCFSSLFLIIGGVMIREADIPSELEAKKSTRDLCYYFKIQELYSHGSFSFFARETAIAFAAILGVPALLAAIVSVFGLVLVGAAIYLSGLFAYLVMRGIYHLATQPDHWTCMTVTVTITGIVAAMAHAYLHGVALGLIALTAGLLSGFVALKTSPVLNLWFEDRPRLANVFRYPFKRHLAMLREVGRALFSPQAYQLRALSVIAYDIQS